MERVPKKMFWVVLFIYILAGNGVAEGFVLCFGADGHIAVEPSHSGLCDSSSKRPLEPVSPASSIPDVNPIRKHVAPCRDFPISVSISDRTTVFHKNQSSHVNMLIAVMASGSCARQDKCVEEKFIFLPSSTIKSPLRFVRTVILLI